MRSRGVTDRHSFKLVTSVPPRPPSPRKVSGAPAIDAVLNDESAPSTFRPRQLAYPHRPPIASAPSETASDDFSQSDATSSATLTESETDGDTDADDLELSEDEGLRRLHRSGTAVPGDPDVDNYSGPEDEEDQREPGEGGKAYDCACSQCRTR